MVHTFFASPERKKEFKNLKKKPRDARRTRTHTHEPQKQDLHTQRNNTKKKVKAFLLFFSPILSCYAAYANKKQEKRNNNQKLKTTLLLRACVHACVCVRACALRFAFLFCSTLRFAPFMICRIHMLLICVFQTILFGEYEILRKKILPCPLGKTMYLKMIEVFFSHVVFVFFLTLHETPTQKKKKFLASRAFVFVDKT